MMERSADAWEHNQFKEIVVKVANIEIYYKVPVVFSQSKRHADVPFSRPSHTTFRSNPCCSTIFSSSSLLESITRAS